MLLLEEVNRSIYTYNFDRSHDLFVENQQDHVCSITARNKVSILFIVWKLLKLIL